MSLPDLPVPIGEAEDLTAGPPRTLGPDRVPRSPVGLTETQAWALAPNSNSTWLVWGSVMETHPPPQFSLSGHFWG